MTVEEVMAWRKLKILAWKIYRQFQKLPGFYLEMEDFHSVAVAAVAAELERDAGADEKLLATIAYRRMVDYGRKCADVSRLHNVFAEDYAGLKRILSVEEIQYQIPSDSSPLESAIEAQVRGWVKVGRFGLNYREAKALRMRYWDGYKHEEIVAKLSKRGQNRALAWFWLRAGERKIREGLKASGAAALRDLAKYHRQLRARSAECRM